MRFNVNLQEITKLLWLASGLLYGCTFVAKNEDPLVLKKLNSDGSVKSTYSQSVQICYLNSQEATQYAKRKYRTCF